MANDFTYQGGKYPLCCITALLIQSVHRLGGKCHGSILINEHNMHPIVLYLYLMYSLLLYYNVQLIMLFLQIVIHLLNTIYILRSYSYTHIWFIFGENAKSKSNFSLSKKSKIKMQTSFTAYTVLLNKHKALIFIVTLVLFTTEPFVQTVRECIALACFLILSQEKSYILNNTTKNQ
jgi:hypothetical protein